MNLLNEKVVDNAKKKDYNGKKKTYYFILLLKGRDDMTNIKKILATTLSILVVISGSMATNAMVAVPNVPHQPFMPPIVGVPTVNSGQLSFKSIKTQIANFFSFSSKTDGQLKNTENLYSDESEEIEGQWEDNNKVYDKIQWKFNPKNGTLTVTGTGAIPYMDGHERPWVKKQINHDQVKTLVIGEGITEVGNCAFCKMTSLQKVYLPKSVTCIDTHAFFYCNSLEEMNFEDSSLTTIGVGALESNNFSKIKLPSSLTNLGYRAFAFNENLKEVKFCGTASPVCGSNVFENCVNLTDVKVPEGYKGSQFCEKSAYCALNENCKIGGSCGENILWELDEDKKELKITGSGQIKDFYDDEQRPWENYEVKKVTISDGITFIGRAAFRNLSFLEDVSLPETLELINLYSFQNCKNLRNVKLPKGLKQINQEAFLGSGLEKIIIPSTVTIILPNAFGNCENLKTIIVEDENENYESCENVLFTKNKETLLQYPSGLEDEIYKVPSGTVKICTNAFSMQNSKLRKVIIPQTVNEIQEFAFASCEKIKLIKFLGNVEKIGQQAFANAYDLHGVLYLGESKPDLSESSIDPFANTALSEVMVKKTYNADENWRNYAVKKILDDSGNINYSCGCNGSTIDCKLDPFTGIMSITGTGEMCSYGSPELVPWQDYKDYVRSIIIDDEITTLGQLCFYDFKNLETVKLPKNLKIINWQVFGNCNKLTSIEFPNGIEHIGTEAFRNTGLKNITLPSSITSLELNVFGECKDLKSIEVEENNANYMSYDGILFTKDKKEILQYPAGLEGRVYEIPDFVEKIGQNSFFLAETSTLEKIIVKDNVKEISDYAFYWCPTLKKIVFYSDINKIGTGAFASAGKLEDFFYCGKNIPIFTLDGYDGSPAFLGNDNLLNIKLKHTHTSAEGEIWGKDKDGVGGKPVTHALNENCKIGGSCGENISWELDDGTLNITGTGEMTNSYGISGGPWKDYKDEITNVIIGDGVESIGNNAFEGCVNLQNVNISESIGQIGSGAFNNCTSLANVNFNGLSDPGCSNVFEDCDKLESVNVPECYENNTFCGKNVSKILDHGSCTEPESSSSMESSQSSSKLSSSSISEVNLGSKRIELIFSKEDIQISSAEESIKDIIDLDPGQYKITVKVIDDEEVKVTVQFVNEDDLNDFHKKVSECTK